MNYKFTSVIFDTVAVDFKTLSIIRQMFVSVTQDAHFSTSLTCNIYNYLLYKTYYSTYQNLSTNYCILHNYQKNMHSGISSIINLWATKVSYFFSASWSSEYFSFSSRSLVAVSLPSLNNWKTSVDTMMYNDTHRANVLSSKSKPLQYTNVLSRQPEIIYMATGMELS